MEDRTQSSRFPYGKNSGEAVAYYQTIKEHGSLRKIQQTFPVKVHSTQRAGSLLKTCDNDRRPPWTLRDRPPGTNQGPRRRNLGALTLGSALDVPSEGDIYQNQPGKQATSTKRRTADATGNGKRNNRNDNLFQATPSNNPSSFMTYHPPSSYKQQTEARPPEDEEILAISYPKDYQPKVVNKVPKRRKVVSLRKSSPPVRG